MNQIALNEWKIFKTNTLPVFKKVINGTEITEM